MTIDVAVVTAPVVTGALALVAPAGTVTLAGTAARLALLLVSWTLVPAAGAALDRVTVACALFPPVTDDGCSTRLVGAGVDVDADGNTVRGAETVAPPPETEIVTTVCVATALVKMLNPPAVAPAGIVTVGGTEASEGLVVATGRARSADCGDAILTVANEPPLWPTVDAGFSVSDAGCACGVNVTGAWAVVPFHDAVTVAVVAAGTALVESDTEAENAPGAMNTDAGGVTAGALLDSVTDAPPAGA